MDFPGGSDGIEFAWKAGNQGSIPGLENRLEKGMATHSSILAWMEEPGGLQSIGSQRVRHSWATNAFIPIDALDLMKYGNGISIWKLLK